MSFLDTFRDFAKMKAMRDALKKERVTVERQGVRVTVGGDFSVHEVVLTPTIPLDVQARLVKECLNEASQKAQVAAAKALKPFQ